jgi:hypothetical protein
MPRGGKRDGAGKKQTLPDGTKPRTIRLTEPEYAKVKSLIEELRKPSK